MRQSAVASIALVAAVIGGAGVLVVARAAGWVGASHVRTVVVTEAAPPVGASAPARVPSISPLVGNAFRPDRIYDRRSPGVVTIYAFMDNASAPEAAQGSGFVVSNDGYILTNSHVITSAGEGGASAPVQSASHVYVEFGDRDRIAARIVGWDVYDDVGLIRVDPQAHPLTPVPLGESARVRVGEPVAAIGSPFGNVNSLSVGVVSAVERSIGSLTSRYNLVDAIQTDAPINHGNSGGPLFDAQGRVIGINAQIRSDSGNAEGVGFAVPIDSARRSMNELIANGRVAYAYVGITTEDLTPALARRFRFPVSHGAVIDTVRPGTPGAAAGLRGGTKEVDVNGAAFTLGGDVVVTIDGKRVTGASDLVRAVSEDLRPGGRARFGIVRDGRRLEVVLRLTERPADPDQGR